MGSCGEKVRILVAKKVGSVVGFGAVLHAHMNTHAHTRTHNFRGRDLRTKENA